MVKKLLLLLLIAGTLWSDDQLNDKIKSLVGDAAFAKNRSFIEIIFNPTEYYYYNGHIDVVKVVETLEENGLLNLFYKKPQSLELTFSTNGPPLFFVKLMGETLRSMGYYRYITKASKLDSATFYWKVQLTTEYATNPTILSKELHKRGCSIIDITKEHMQSWVYDIDMTHAHLNLQEIQEGQQIVFNRSLYAHWLDVSKVKKLRVTSNKGNYWFPYIAYYDNAMRLLKVYKRDKKSWQLKLTLPRDTAYIKLADLYTLKNIKSGLQIEGIGQK
ncbi:MAG: hypothetical protein U9Q62_12270 [Campylobacterota bacterium]|nr:hypothetical protein [Campylobacterota bacterium]